MKEYIEKEKFKEELMSRGIYPVIVKNALENSVVPDVFKVVYCQNCKHCKKELDPAGGRSDYYCRNLGRFTERYFYCKDGEENDTTRG